VSKFKPKPLSPESYEAPMEAQWRVMGAAEEKRLHEAAVSTHRRFQPFGPRMKRRLVRYVIGSAVGFFVLCFAFVAMRFTTCLTFAGVGALVGAVFARLRPPDHLAGAIYALCGVAAAALASQSLFKTVFTGFFFYVVGLAVGMGETMKESDGDA
jgi:hypothetical protein